MDKGVTEKKPHRKKDTAEGTKTTEEGEKSGKQDLPGQSRKPERFVLKERDSATGGILLAAASCMLAGGVLWYVFEGKDGLFWTAFLALMSLPLIALAAFFLRRFVFIIDDSYLRKATRHGKKIRVPWESVSAVSLEQGVGDDRSVAAILLWISQEDCSSYAFTSTDELGIDAFLSVAAELQRRADAKGVPFENRTKIGLCG